MPATLTRADSLRQYLTGASSDGGSQSNPQLSLGNFASATEALSYGIAITGTPITGITIDYASGGNNLGAGTLVLIDPNSVAWADAGGSQGAAVTLANGIQSIVEAAGNPGHFLRITRVTPAALTGGPATVTLSTLYDNLWGMDDVSAANAVSGITEYFAAIVKNLSASSILNFTRWIGQLGTQQISDGGQLSGSGAGSITTTGSFANWPNNGWCQIQTSLGALKEIVYYSSRTTTTLTVPAGGRARLGTSATAGANNDKIFAVPGIAIGIDSAGVQTSGVAIQTIANSQAAPSGITWNTGLNSGTGLNVGTLAVSKQVGIWIKREVPAGAVSNPALLNSIVSQFDAP